MREEGVRETFERFSADYDARFPKIIPHYAEFHGVIAQRIAEHAGPGSEGLGGLVLELGCGTGELSRRLLQTLPGLRLHCIDLSPAMIERARAKLAPWGERVSFAVGNFLSTRFPEGAAAAVSCLAVHHLDAGEKRALFGRLFDCLAPGGTFALGDAVTGGSSFYDEYYRRCWVDHMRASGLDEEEVAGVLDDHERNDRFSSLDEQMRWLREAGFERVECLWKHFLLAVVASEKEPG
jgi:tRNA (cmo5U34)-methyltransferase